MEMAGTVSFSVTQHVHLTMEICVNVLVGNQWHFGFNTNITSLSVLMVLNIVLTITWFCD